MPEPNHNYALMCLRLAADCHWLAAEVPMHLRAHYVLMADVWTELANHPEAEQPLPH